MFSLHLYIFGFSKSPANAGNKTRRREDAAKIISGSPIKLDTAKGALFDKEFNLKRWTLNPWALNLRRNPKLRKKIGKMEI